MGTQQITIRKYKTTQVKQDKRMWSLQEKLEELKR